MSWEPALPYAVLLQDTNGYKESKSMFTYGSSFSCKNVLKGTILLRLSQEEVRELRHQQTCSGPPFNFKVHGDSGVKLFCRTNDVHLLNYKQKEILLALSTALDRFEAVHKLEWAEKLTEGSNVYVVNMPTFPAAVKGIVRYIGKLPGESGTKFGVELLVRMYV